ncbi:unnamed protein product, partial [Musa acuminata subsp. burmannicoides]
GESRFRISSVKGSPSPPPRSRVLSAGLSSELWFESSACSGLGDLAFLMNTLICRRNIGF